MKVTAFLPFDDIGGVGFRTARAFERYTDWEYKAYVQHPSYLQFPRHSVGDWETIDRDWTTADVRHGHDIRPEIEGLLPEVMTYHGTGYREYFDSILPEICGLV